MAAQSLKAPSQASNTSKTTSGEVANGFEGGVTIEGFNDWQEDDVIEAYSLQQVR